MPELLTNVAVQDQYSLGATLGPALDVEQLTFQVFTNPVFGKFFKPQFGDDNRAAPIEEAVERFFPVGTLLSVAGCAGVQFRNANAGFPATVNAEIAFKGDPLFDYQSSGLFSAAQLLTSFLHNNSLIAAESTLDFEDTATTDEAIVWSVVDTPGTKMAVSATLAFHAANKDSVANQVFSGAIQTPALGVNAAIGAAGTITLSGRIFSGGPGTGGIWVDGGVNNQFVGSTSATQFGFYNGIWGFVMDNNQFTSFQGSFGARTGVGNGAVVTQTTSLSTAVTINNICGQINTFTSALAGGLNVVFNVNNSFVTSTDMVVVCWSNNPWSGNIPIWVTGIFAGVFQIAYTNLGALTSSQTGRINFFVIKSANN